MVWKYCGRNPQGLHEESLDDITQYEHADATYMCFRVSLVQGTSFVFALYRPQKDATVIFDQLGQSNIYKEGVSVCLCVCLYVVTNFLVNGKR